MSRICELCEKSYMKANQVKRLIGKRVSGRSIIRQAPNLRYKKFVIDGTPMKIRLCTSCLKKIRGQGAKDEAQAIASK